MISQPETHKICKLSSHSRRNARKLLLRCVSPSFKRHAYKWKKCECVSSCRHSEEGSKLAGGLWANNFLPPAMRPGRDLFVQPSGAARCEWGIKPLRNSSLHHIRILRRGMGVRSRRTWLQREEGGECRWHIVTQSWSYCPPKTREDPFFKTGFFRY